MVSNVTDPGGRESQLQCGGARVQERGRVVEVVKELVAAEERSLRAGEAVQVRRMRRLQACDRPRPGQRPGKELKLST